MAGILNNKTRIMDVIVTSEGRRQLNSGRFRPEFASFTDSQAFYESDAVSGSSDATDRITFESVSLPSDKIFLEYDDSGRLLGSSDPKVTVVGEGIFSASNIDGAVNGLVSGGIFTDLAQTLITGSINNLKSHQILGSHKSENNSYRFDISQDTVEFLINNYEPFGVNPNKKTANINAIEPLIFDKRVNHSEIFQFLPPVRDDGRKYGHYEDLNQKSILSFDDLIDEIGELPDERFRSDADKVDMSLYGQLEDSYVNAVKQNKPQFTGKPKKVIKFTNTTQSNNMFCQIFQVDAESHKRSMLKLEVIDFGTFRDNNDLNRPEKHVFFVGRNYTGYGNLPTFVNLFTIVFD